MEKVGGRMTVTLDYAQPLRAIGQALETLQVQRFDMGPVADGFFVRGAVATASTELLEDSIDASKLRTIWGAAPRQAVLKGEGGKSGKLEASYEMELLYTEEDVERLEEQGRARRVDARGSADPSTLSQLLRCLGGYLSEKRALLLKIIHHTDWVTLEYETSAGTHIRETLRAADIREIWMSMYLKRTGLAV